MCPGEEVRGEPSFVQLISANGLCVCVCVCVCVCLCVFVVCVLEMDFI